MFQFIEITWYFFYIHFSIGYNQFCAEQFCEFNYEGIFFAYEFVNKSLQYELIHEEGYFYAELESLKPQKQCQPVRHSLNRLCKL